MSGAIIFENQAREADHAFNGLPQLIQFNIQLQSIKQKFSQRVKITIISREIERPSGLRKRFFTIKCFSSLIIVDIIRRQLSRSLKVEQRQQTPRLLIIHNIWGVIKVIGQVISEIKANF